MNHKTKKNVVLVTWKGSGNFGTCLQSYALHRKLEDMGYFVQILSPIPQEYTLKLHIKWILKILGLGKLKKILFQKKNNTQKIKLDKFQKECYNDISLYTQKQEIDLLNRTDCFITGSDQIWNTYYRFSPFYFLDFVRGKKCIAYASSIGTSGVKEEYKDEVRFLLSKFSHIGVRENEAVHVLSELTGRDDIIQVLDPTFLLNPNDWHKMVKTAKYEMNLPKDYLFCYLIGNNPWYHADLMNVRERLGIKNIVIIPSAENPGFTSDEAITYRNACPVEFVDLIKHAKCVCTDSFHATALSINFSIPFVEFIRFNDNDIQSQNSRLYDLLNHYGLMNRIYNKDCNIWEAPINYNKIQQILDKDRDVSLSYLTNAIEN